MREAGSFEHTAQASSAFQGFETSPGASQRIQTLLNTPHWYNKPEVIWKASSLPWNPVEAEEVSSGLRPPSSIPRGKNTVPSVPTCHSSCFPNEATAAVVGAPYPALALGQVKLISPSNLMQYPLSSFPHFTNGKLRYKSVKVLPRGTQLGGDRTLL